MCNKLHACLGASFKVDEYFGCEDQWDLETKHIYIIYTGKTELTTKSSFVLKLAVLFPSVRLVRGIFRGWIPCFYFRLYVAF